MRGAAVSSAAAGGFVVFLLSMSVIQSRYGWRVTYTPTRICALKGSTVEIRCTYTYPPRINGRDTRVKETLWFTKERDTAPVDLRTDSQYSGRVHNHCENNICTLRISNLTESDAALFKFRFTTNHANGKYTGLPGVTLSIRDPDVQVQGFSTAELKCHSRCLLPDQTSYVWYKNGRKLEEETSSYSGSVHRADSFACALKGREGFPSPSVCVVGQTCNRVTYTDRSICAFKGSSVDISCTYNTYNSYQYITSQFWFRPERSPQWKNPSQPEDLSEDSQFAGRVQVFETKGGRSTLRISDLRESDSAEYQFKFQTRSFEWRSSLPGTTLTVAALQVQVITASVHQSHTEAELRCHSSCSPADRLSYIWFKNGQKIQEEASSYTDNFYPGDNISCAFKGHETHGSPSVYALKVPSVSTSPGEIMEGRSVNLTCNSDTNSVANYTWYKKNETIRPRGEDPQLVFSSIQSSDSGDYSCAAENQLGRRTSGYISVDVKYAPKTSTLSVSPSDQIMEGRSVTLSCSSDANPAANYTWYKENQTLIQGPGGRFHFTSISSEDRGTYYCKSENHHGQLDSKSVFINVQYAPKLPSVSVSPSGQIVEGRSVTLNCSSDANPAANYTWYKEDEDSPKALGQIFNITEFRAEHSGKYYCEAQNRRGRLRSTFHQIVVAGAWKSTTIGKTTALVLAVILLSVFILIRRKRALNQPSEAGERPDNRKQYLLTQRQPDDEQDELHYASVQFSKTQADCLYSNIRPAQPLRHEEDEDEGVEYTAINFKGGSAAPRRQKMSALYSTIH